MMDRTLMQERMLKEAMATKKEQGQEPKKEHTLEDTIEEMKAVREAQNAGHKGLEGAWRIIVPPGSQAVAHFVRYSETDQYNLMTEYKYPSERNANLALALLTRPTQLTYTERMQLHGILLEE